MRATTGQIDDIVAMLATVHDDEFERVDSPAAQALLATILATDVHGAAAPVPGTVTRPRTSTHRRVPRRRLVMTSGVIGIVALALAVALATTGTHGTQPASAATVLRQAAQTARSQAPLVLGRADYVYTKSVNAYLATTVIDGRSFSVLAPKVREIWQGPGGGRLRETTGEPRFLSERDRQMWIAAGRPDLGGARSSDESLPPLRPLDLPSDPDVLYARLKQDAAGRGSGLYEEMFTLIGDALRETSASPAQRAALYTVAARIPGVELVGRVTDPAGRTGVAVAMADEANKIRHTLVFDPETAVLLAEEQVALAGNEFGYPAGTRVGYSTYLKAAIVTSTDERP